MSPFRMCETRLQILDSQEHILIEGGPGSGKTTIALLKAKELIDKGFLSRNQKILFLSFARATVSRVEEQARSLITKEHSKLIEISTYHSFSWQIAQSYGYLAKNFRFLKLITPPNLVAKTTNLDKDQELALKKSLLNNEGILCFDLFCEFTVEVFTKSPRIRSIISDAYPYIIVDEFQDTDEHEWNMIKLLGEQSKIMALADLDQRIYEFRGASITRIPEFTNYFSCAKFDLGKENNRSANTDIVQFGDDLLTGTNKGKNYSDVQVHKYKNTYYEPKISLKNSLSKSIERLKKIKPDGNWSIAVLVKSRQETLSVSNYLSTKTTLPQYYHEVLIDPAGPALAANVIAKIMEPFATAPGSLNSLILSIINHLKGRGNNRISQKDLQLSLALENYLQTGKVRGKNRVQLILDIERVLEKRNQLTFEGVPENDWLSVRKHFADSQHEALKNIYEDAKYLRLLNRGAILSEKLSEVWREKNEYSNATAFVEDALTQEHFSMTSRKWKGIFVMTIHKSKGKEFDEVIIWEEQYKPIIPMNASLSRLQQDKLVLRVAATRAKSRTTFLTPAVSPCVLL